MKFIVTVHCGSDVIKIEYDKPISLMNAINDSGFVFDAPCGGKNICGNCKVFAFGGITPPSEKEIVFFDKDIENGTRLACMTAAVSDTTVFIPKIINLNTSKSNSLKLDISPISEEKSCFACAVDVGTTTLVFRYFSLPEGKLVFEESIPNPQSKHGSDVLTRIEFCSNGGLHELKDELENSIEESKNRFGSQIEYYVITGNTTMLHILSGRNPEGIAVAPFEPETLFGFWEGNRYYMRCTSAYIGADAVASLLASRITETKENALLLDIGTNNECILWNGNELTACSSPAGPAFEGGNISCGMTAFGGAIYKIDDKDGHAKAYTVNESEEPIGFCGSGLIDAVAYYLRNGYIEKDGSVSKELSDFGKAKLTPEDIAELQLAKSAVCAGILTLLNESNLQIEDIKSLYLTGNFGNYINIDNAKIIGMIPKNINAAPLGYSAIDGASMVLLNEDFIKKSEELAKEIKTIELADSEFFVKSFIENMYF